MNVLEILWNRAGLRGVLLEYAQGTEQPGKLPVTGMCTGQDMVGLPGTEGKAGPILVTPV